VKVMIIVKATKASEACEMPSTELLTSMGNYNEALVNAGIMLDGAGLTPSSQGARVRFSGASRTVMNGPFAETRELIAGFWVWNVKSLEEAIEWVKKCPNPMLEDSEIEIRPYFEAEDFGDSFTPELREQEATIRAVTLGLNSPTFQFDEQRKIAGINKTYSMENRSSIPQQWAMFVPRAHELEAIAPEVMYGVCWNTKPSNHFDYLTGVQVHIATQTPEGMLSLEIAGSRYAVFAHTGHVSSLPKTIDTIWTKWVPECGLPIAQTPCFERYTQEFDPSKGLGGMEIWIPLHG
jgi:AraC family transcriptional regulator